MSDKALIDGRWKRPPKLLPTFAERLDESRASYLYKEWKKTEAAFLRVRDQLSTAEKSKAFEEWKRADTALTKEIKRAKKLDPRPPNIPITLEDWWTLSLWQAEEH